MLTAGVHGPTGTAGLVDCLISAHRGHLWSYRDCQVRCHSDIYKPQASMVLQGCRVRCLSDICTPQVFRRDPTGLPSSWTTGQQRLALTASSPCTDRNQIPTWTAKPVRQRARWPLRSGNGTTVFAYSKCPVSCRDFLAVVGCRV